MISKLDKNVHFHQQALGLRAARHALLASNVANADTPNFKAKDIDFSSVLKEKLASSTSTASLTTTSPMHIGGNKHNSISNNALYRVPLQPSADGNTVDMDLERTQFANNSIKYDAGITFISGQFKSLLSAIQER